jgi:copper chaperone CopZ
MKIKKTFKVKGMHCSSCEMLIKDSLEETKGVNAAEASHKKASVSVDYDEAKISEKMIKSIIKSEGYEVLE